MKESLIGQKIVDIREMTPKEMSDESWYPDNMATSNPVAIVMEGGDVLYASSDGEGNAPGCIFGVHEGESYTLQPIKRKAQAKPSTKKEK